MRKEKFEEKNVACSRCSFHQPHHPFVSGEQALALSLRGAAVSSLISSQSNSDLLLGTMMLPLSEQLYPPAGGKARGQIFLHGGPHPGRQKFLSRNPSKGLMLSHLLQNPLAFPSNPQEAPRSQHTPPPFPQPSQAAAVFGHLEKGIRCRALSCLNQGIQNQAGSFRKSLT